MIKILKHMRKNEWQLFFINVLLIFTQVYLDLKLPDYMSVITKLVKTEGSDINLIYQNGMMMLLCAFGSLICAIITRYFSAKLASSFSRHLREEVFDRVQAFSMEEIEKFSTASLITRSTNDVQQVQNFIARGLRMIVRAPILAVWAMMKISTKNWQWTTLTGVAVFIVLCTVTFILVYARPRFYQRQTLTDAMNRVMRENMTGIRVVRAYNAEKYQQAKFDEANDRLTQNTLEARRAMSMMHPITRLNHNFLSMGIYCVGAFLIAGAGSSEQLEIFSDMVVFSNYASKILQAFMSLDQIFSELPRATVSVIRINELLQTEPVIHDGTSVAGKEESGTVTFEHVSFQYPDTEEYVIEDISFSVKHGETVAFIGATGSGKTTLVNLIPRFHDVSAGAVLVNGTNVKDYQQEALHNLIGYAPQRAVLFTGTVRDNVDYGKNARTPEEPIDVKKACEIAQASEFIERMEDGYDSFISRGGTNVSGGQKQRISVARTVYRKPQIYIFDDTFSALDYKTDSTLRKQLKKQTAGVTTLIVAQRIGTIRDADQIIVLEEGKIAGKGTHQELLHNCAVYREIASTQLSEKELA